MKPNLTEFSKATQWKPGVQVGANTVITYDANDTVTLTGVAASHLTASNFQFT